MDFVAVNRLFHTLSSVENNESSQDVVRYDGNQFLVGEGNKKILAFLGGVKRLISFVSCCQCHWLDEKIERINNRNQSQQGAAIERLNALFNLSLKDRSITVSMALKYCMTELQLGAVDVSLKALNQA
ncbi:hypothetical protein GCM10023116_24870 [Kistimonas scapharcae]|uniref:Uncharacterized protein n=1 Tax=Kistimonas scapharcae TaxID=1036133 RepID=A0ABP8V479_9GAMM